MKNLDPMQQFILLLAGIVLTIALIYMFFQVLKQRRLMKKGKSIDRDIRERKATTWITDFQHYN